MCSVLYQGFFTSLLFFLLASCGDQEAFLYGNWQAVEITQEGDSMRLDPAEVGFVFEPGGRYSYRSSLNYREAGHYHYQTGYLFATDTTHENSAERIVALEQIGIDSIRITMRHDTTNRFLLFIKQ